MLHKQKKSAVGSGQWAVGLRCALPTAHRPLPTCRSGVASILAMIYLMLFSVLALGFFAMTTTSVQIAKNDNYGARALFAAESGMEFVRYQMDNLDVRANYDFTAPPVFLAMYSQLGTALNGTATMNGNTLGLSLAGTTIYIPSSGWISTDGKFDASGNPTGPCFNATITHSGDKFIVKVTGKDGSATIMRALQLSFQKAPNASTIFNYGVASKGRVVTSGSSWIMGPSGTADPLGSVLSADPTSANPVDIEGKGVSGDISIVTDNSVTYGNATSIGGSSNDATIATHIHKDITPPDFPQVDTTGFMSYATNAYSSGANTLTNVTVPANTNPTFNGNMTINGVLVINPPNKVTFNGNLTVNGVIVSPASPGGSYPSFNASNNQLNFKGGVTVNPVSSLGSSYGNLTTMTGSFVLAPNFYTSFSGNFHTINGSIISGQVDFNGNAGGTIQGSIIGLEQQPLSIAGSSDITIQGRGTSAVPTGVSFGDHLAPLPGTYDEVSP